MRPDLHKQVAVKVKAVPIELLQWGDGEPAAEVQGGLMGSSPWCDIAKVTCSVVGVCLWVPGPCSELCLRITSLMS